ncbi:MAG: ferric enterobactin receptor [Marinoscillum sp.]|jgi:ferric enterobactin receptor
MYRLFALLMILCSVAFANAREPEMRISETFTNAPLQEVLDALEKKYKIRFAYSERLVSSVSITVHLENESLTSAMHEIFDKSALDFEVLLPDAVIIKKGSPPSDLINIQGLVKDAKSGENLPFVYFYRTDENKSIVSNEDGFFAFENLRPDAQILVSYIGYQDTTILAKDLVPNQRWFLGLLIDERALDEIIVSSKLKSNFEPSNQIGTITVNPRFARQLPATAEPDCFRAIQLLPGVTSTNELSSGLAINGGTASQNLVIFDGIPIYHVDHFFGYISTINPMAYKTMRLMKGGFEAKYGGRSSSMVSFVGKDGNTEKVAGHISFNQLSINTALEVPLSDRTHFFISARRSYTDIISTSLFESIFSLYENNLDDPIQNTARIKNEEFNPEFYYTDLNFKISTKIGLSQQLEFSFYDSNDILNYDQSYDIAFSGDTTVSRDNIGFISWGNVGTSLKWSSNWNESHYTIFTGSYSDYRSTYDKISVQQATNSADNQTLDESQDNFIKDASLRVDHDWMLPYGKIQFGGGISIFNTQFNSTQNDSIIAQKNQENIWQSNHYIQYDVPIGTKMNSNIGMRSSYLSSTGKFYWEPRFSLNYQPIRQLSLQLATGIYRQFVTQLETQNVLQGSRDLWLVADGTIPDQRAVHLLMGGTLILRSLDLSVSYFHKSFDGLLDYAYRRGGLITEFENFNKLFFSGQGRSNGMELMLKKHSGQFNGWIGYTYSKTFASYPDLADGITFYADHDQRHEVNIFGSYEIGAFSFFATGYYGSGLPYTNYSLVIGNNNNQKVVRLKPDEKNGERLPSYQRVDIGMSYKHTFSSGSLTLSGNIFNVLNHENIYDRRVEVVQTTRKIRNRNVRVPTIIPYDVKLMGLTPSFSVAFDF